MELTVYRQGKKEREDGTIVYKGEDARPYVDTDVFFVADGLGGAAAIRHQQIRPGLFDDNKLMDTLFSGVYDEYSDERFVKYVKDSFFELFAVKDCYNDNVNNLKKSGYFGSRIATAIFLHAIIYDNELNPQNIFKEIDNRNSLDAKKEYIDNLEKKIADKIRIEMSKIAQNANLIYETKFSGLALLGTTLCATVFRELADSVEALYFTAGDCRPYIWNEEEGLCQLLREQEGEDGAMTNYIRANGEKPFEIECDYFSLKKPCVLFNASDGCFDSAAFLSPMGYEILILVKSIESANESELSKKLEDFFDENGRHDDSSTMAMKFFGYGSFEEYKQSAARRMKYLQDNYLSKLPKLLDHKYSSEKEIDNTGVNDPLNSLKIKFEEEVGFWDIIKRIYKSKNGQIKENNVEDKKIEVKQQILMANEMISCIIRRNYQFFYGELNRLDGNALCNSYDVSKQIDRISELLYSKSINLENIRNYIIQDDYKLLEQNLAIVESCQEKLRELNKIANDVYSNDEIKAFWDKEYGSIIKELVNNTEYSISDGLRMEAEALLSGRQAENDQDYSILQMKLFEQYEKSYVKYMEVQQK